MPRKKKSPRERGFRTRDEAAAEFRHIADAIEHGKSVGDPITDAAFRGADWCKWFINFSFDRDEKKAEVGR